MQVADETCMGSAALHSLFPGEGEVTRHLRAIDWAATPLGVPEGWPLSLRTAVSICLGAGVPMCLWWGPRRITFYNDAATPLVGERHPAALGVPGPDGLGPLWQSIEPAIEQVMTTGQPGRIERLAIAGRAGGREEHASGTLSPLAGGEGSTEGVFCTLRHGGSGMDSTAPTEGRWDPLRDSEAKLISLFTRAAVGLSELSLDGRFLRVNDELCRLLGRPRGELLRLAVQDVTHPDDVAPSFAAVARVVETGEPASIDKRYLRPDGGEVIANSTVTRLDGPDGRVRTLLAVTVDVTGRARVEAALSENETRLRRALAIQTVGVLFFRLDGRVTAANAAFERMSGYRAAQLAESFHWKTFTAESHWLLTAQAAADLAESGETAPYEKEMVRPDGSRWWGLFAPTRLAGSGRASECVEFIIDITETKAAAEALRRSEEQLRLLVENVHDHAIFTLDTEGRITSWNPGAGRIFQYGASEILGRNGGVLFTPEDLERHEEKKELAAAARDGRASDDRWQMRRDGTRFWASGVTSAIRDSRGALLGYTKVLRDETEAKLLAQRRDRLLEQEQAALREAQQAMVLKDEFLAVVSHELRTPLSAILLWAKMLKAGLVQGPDLQEAVDSIVRSAEAQRQLVEDLLDMSRMTSGQLRLNVRETELAPVVQAAVDAVRVTAEVKGVMLGMTLDQHAGCVRADADRLQQVVWNLLSNAVKFTGQGGRVDVRLRRLDDVVEITVSDTGRGIPPEFLPYVFEWFRQADASSTRVHGGLGLGLAISRQLVELHGGTIRAESAGEGRGATFTVELPVTGTVADCQSAGMAASDTPAVAALRGRRVLLVEDEPETRKAIERVLRECGVRVVTADSAAAGLELFAGTEGEPFDLLISDIGLPVQNGYEFMRRVRELEREHVSGLVTPAIALTAYARKSDRTEAMVAGFQVHLAKPVDPVRLVEEASRLVTGGRGVAGG
jgi:PAS domain S-box-containing protein